MPANTYTEVRTAPLAWRRWVLGAALLATLGFGLIQAIRTTISEVMIVAASNTLNAWDTAREVPDLAAWTRLHELLERAIWLTPRDSEQYRTLGLAHEWRFFLADSPVTTEAELVATRQAAIDAYRQSALLRPAWAVGWASLAKQKIILGQEDEELLLALDRAVILGPNEALVRQVVTDVATLSWTFLETAPAVRDRVLAMIETSLRPPQSAETLQHLRHIIDRNMQTELCPLMKVDTLADWAQEACAFIPERSVQ